MPSFVIGIIGVHHYPVWIWIFFLRSFLRSFVTRIHHYPVWIWIFFLVFFLVFFVVF